MEADHALSLQSPLAGLDDPNKKERELRQRLNSLLIAARNPSQHFEELDIQLSQLLPHGLHKHPSQVKTQLQCSRTHPTAPVEDILSRLPALPQQRHYLPLSGRNLEKNRKTLWDGIKGARWTARYALPKARPKIECEPSDNPEELLLYISELQGFIWDNLFVTTFLDTNSIVLAKMVADLNFKEDFTFAQDCLRYANLLTTFMDELEAMQDAVKGGIEEIFGSPEDPLQSLRRELLQDVMEQNSEGCSMLRTFLWTVWQRSIMLYFYYVIGVQLHSGYSSKWNALLSVRAPETLSELEEEDYRGNGVDYLCNWAFELLRTSRSAVGLDFRRLLSRFDAQFHGRVGRCKKDSDYTCEGDNPDTCERFTGAEQKAQSAHARSCDGLCLRILWDRSSYERCEGPQAALADAELKVLQYRQTSSDTLAISHVWSHGHGGRPEMGINSCLHRLYCQLAKACHCGAYWIDSSCIPSEGPLRKAAIKNINRIFIESKVTVIIDEDIQSVDISSLSILQLETLLSVFLVCDWNVRAWTMLEGIRGSESINLLCKNEQLVPVRYCLQRVHKEGSIDLAVLLGTTQHLIPQSDAGSPKTLEEGSHLLSQRHASRKGDEIIIWSLLNNGPGVKEAADFWEVQKSVRTGYLMSHVSRVEGTGSRGWAPQSPYIRPQTRCVEHPCGKRQFYTVRFPSYDGQGSFRAQITPQGLRSKWRAIEMESRILSAFSDDCLHMMEATDDILKLNPHLPAETAIYTYPDEAHAYHLMQMLVEDKGRRVRLLRPLAEDGVSPYEGSNHREERIGLIAAICDSSDDGQTWNWKSVHEWSESDSSYDWKVEEMLIV